MPYGSILHIPPTNLLVLAAKQESYKKAYLLTKNIGRISGKSSGEWTSRQKKDKTERVIGLGRGTGEGIVKLNQITALRFHKPDFLYISVWLYNKNYRGGKRDRTAQKRN